MITHDSLIVTRTNTRKAVVIFLAVGKTCGSSRDRDQTLATAGTGAAAVIMQILNPLHHRGTLEKRCFHLLSLDSITPIKQIAAIAPGGRVICLIHTSIF